MSITATTTTRRSNPDHVRSAFICGLIPLITGTSIFLLWVVTRWDWLIAAGMLTIMAGIVASLFGIACLVASRLDRPAVEIGGSRRESRRRIIALLIILSNFPVAASIVVAVDLIHTLYAVTIVNRGSVPVDNVVVAGGGVEIEFGSVAPGTTSERWFHVRNDGELVYRVRRGGEDVDGTIEGYVTNGFGGDMEVTFNHDGSIVVRDKRPSTKANPAG
jgi:hypothetical protein